MRFLVKCLICLSLVSVLGCGGQENEKVITVEGYNPTALLKKEMEGFAESGSPIMSKAMHLKSLATKVGESDAKKGESLEKLIDELGSMKDADKIKAKAKEIAALL